MCHFDEGKIYTWYKSQTQYAIGMKDATFCVSNKSEIEGTCRDPSLGRDDGLRLYVYVFGESALHHWRKYSEEPF